MTKITKLAFIGFFIATSIVFSLNAQAAKAGFRKALDAYIARDGEVMLAAVKEAVDKKDDDGLLLFLNALQSSTSQEQSSACVAYQKILSSKQALALRKLLDTAVSNSTTFAQWVHLTRPEFSSRFRPKWIAWKESAIQSKSDAKRYQQVWRGIYDKELNRLANAGSADALERVFDEKKESKEASKLMEASAKLGDPYMSISMAFLYLNWESDQFYSHTYCSPDQSGLMCLSYDKHKAMQYLKTAIQHIIRRPMYFSGLMREMGDYEWSTHKGKRSNPKQAYLWYLWGLNSLTNPGNDSSSEVVFVQRLQRMKDAGQLEVAAPDLNKVWGDVSKRHHILYPKRLLNFPDVAKEALKAQGRPIFEYIDAGLPNYSVRLYQNGDVYLHFLWNSTTPQRQEIYTKKTKAEIKRFMTKLEKIRFDEWPLASPYYGKDETCTSQVCVTDSYMGVVNYKGLYKAVIMSQDNGLVVDVNKEKRIGLMSSLVQKHLLMSDVRSIINCRKHQN